jgi:hypothetical protein
MDEAIAVKLLLESALPIDNFDQMIMLPGKTLILVWIDMQDRPDLSDMADLHGPGKGTFFMTWFALLTQKRGR